MKKNKMLPFILTTVTTVAIFSSCGQDVVNVENSKTQKESEVVSSETTESSEVVIDKSKLPILSLYPINANLTSGLVKGHKADFFAENGFQLEVWAYSAEKMNALLASGNLPDIMYVSTGGSTLQTMIEAGMILNLEDYLDQIPHLYSNEYIEEALNVVRKFNSAETGKLYGLPVDIGLKTSNHSCLRYTDRNAVKLRWDIYEEIGAPEINDYWELIDVMEEMVKVHPTEADGTKCYGTFLDNGQDKSYFGAMTLWFRWQGYTISNLRYMLESNVVTDEHTSILTKDSLYYEGLKWYNEVYRRGLMDPDSINTDRGTQAIKIDNGLAMVPSGTLPGWDPIYYEYYIPGTNIYYSGINKAGDGVIVINAETEHLEECLAFLDMMCNPDAVTRIKYGPDGDIWYADGEKAFLTEAAVEWLESGNTSFNGFPMSDGTEWITWNTHAVVSTGNLNSMKDNVGNARSICPEYWNEAVDIALNNEMYKKWQETTGYENWKEWLEEEDAYYGTSAYDDYSYYLSTPDDKMQLILSSLKDIVVTASWNMVYADTDAEFDALWDKMIADCQELNAQSVIDWRLADIENAKKLLAE